MPHMNRWIVAAPLSVALGLAFSHFNVPAAWILAGIIGGEPDDVPPCLLVGGQFRRHGVGAHE